MKRVICCVLAVLLTSCIPIGLRAGSQLASVTAAGAGLAP
jgi:hypothetical protein